MRPSASGAPGVAGSGELDTEALKSLHAKPPVSTVAFLDFLGFRSYLDAYPLSLVIAHQQAIERANTNMMNLFGESVALAADLSRARVRRLRISDSIVVFGEEDSVASSLVVTGLASSICATAVLYSMPMRAAITRGELFVDEAGQLVLGKALVRAHDLEQNQNWCGGLVDIGPLERNGRGVVRNALEQTAIAISGIEVALKRPIEGEMLALGWPSGFPLNADQTRERLAIGMDLADERIRIKLDNTMRFFDKFRLKYSGTKFAPPESPHPDPPPNLHPSRYIQLQRWTSESPPPRPPP